MNLDLTTALESLAHTPRILDAQLRGRSDAWLTCRKSPETFSPMDVVGHLILAETTNWLPRVQTILQNRDKAHQDTRVFPPFDRFAFQPIIACKPIAELLATFATLRAQSLETLHGLHLTEHELTLPGLHPDFGPVTLGNLLATWVVHDLGHITQITKTMANEYSDAVGPWRAYLSVLR
jgi:hypothetical protein